MNLMTVVGARPQFIKAAAVSRAIRDHNGGIARESIREVIVHTGQHFDAQMSSVFFQQLGIPAPDHNLGISSLAHGAMTGRMLESIEGLIEQDAPDVLLVYGDTNSTLAGALAAAKLRIPVAHVEAGLRSGNPAMPEELNRVLTDRLSSLLFCPTDTAVHNLQAEGYPFPCHPRSWPSRETLRDTAASPAMQRIEEVGDVMYDASLYYAPIARERVRLAQWELSERAYCLCTLHRAENTDNVLRLREILKALRCIANDCTVVLPIHPRTHKRLSELGELNALAGLLILDPLPYLEMLRLQMSAEVILTDSGGLQKEAFFHRVPCITLRNETEWRETVELGWNRLVGANHHAILAAWRERTRPAADQCRPYGGGKAAESIVATLANSSW